MENPSTQKKGLGRGLAALLGEADLPFVKTNAAKNQQAEKKGSATAPAGATIVDSVAVASEQDAEYRIQRLKIDLIKPNAEQPRQHFSDARIQELAESICEQGLIQPIVVRMMPDQSYQIVAGERRWRACKSLGMTEVPAIIKAPNEQVAHSDLASVIENIQRVDLNAVELADAYARILKLYDFTQEELAKKLGVSRVSIANTLRLQKLPKIVKESIVQGKLTEGHARALLMLEKEEDLLSLAQETLDNSLSVRDVEARVRHIQHANDSEAASGTQKTAASAAKSTVSTAGKSPQTLAAEEELRNIFGTKVVVRGNAKGGAIELFYANEDSLHRLIHQLRSVK